MGKRHPHVTNVDELDWSTTEYGSRFACNRKGLAAGAGGKKLGCSLFEVAPGKRAFPLHAHFGKEEALYILEGEGTLRLSDGQIPVRAGDYMAFLVGQAHQLVNTSNAPLRYLCFSTQESPEVVTYPDSDKLGVLTGEPLPMRVLFKRSAGGTTMADYFDDNE